MENSWDNTTAVTAYGHFEATHDRYATANADLVAHAGLTQARRVLDIGAGLGGTTLAALPRLSPLATVLCWETATAMRRAGSARVTDARVRWITELPKHPASVDRILCGAASWQLTPLDATFRYWHELLVPGGSVSFNIPAAYLGVPDPPGGGDDPYLTSLVTELAALGLGAVVNEGPSLPGPDLLQAQLRAQGFSVSTWSLTTRLTQTAYRDWLKVPAVNASLLGKLPPQERAAQVDTAFQRVDPTAWRHEVWLGWTATRER